MSGSVHPSNSAKNFAIEMKSVPLKYSRNELEPESTGESSFCPLCELICGVQGPCEHPSLLHLQQSKETHRWMRGAKFRLTAYSAGQPLDVELRAFELSSPKSSFSVVSGLTISKQLCGKLQVGQD